MVTIGVLALQGAVKEHIEHLTVLPQVNAIQVRKAEDLRGIDGLILPGGESTAIGKLLQDFQLAQPIKDRVKSGMPIWGTCAGMILLAKTISGQEQHHLALMDICVRRNAYGSQLDSFSTELTITEVSPSPIPLVFIRAPYVEKAGSGAKVLATVDGKIVAVEEENMLATAFHPELTNDVSFHRYFVKKIKTAL